MTPDEVRRLAVRAARRDATAFADLYSLYAPQLLQYIGSRVSGRQEAEDLTNAVFEKAFAAIGRYQPSPVLFSTWLYTIARNVVIDHYRRKRLPIQEDAEEELRRATDPEGDPEARVLADELRRQLRQALMELTDDQRQVVGYRFFFNLSVHEVAMAMGKTEGAVKALQFRALERLRRRLAPGLSRT
ncbi:MAG: sigma-70 family RNA polymerase sigma factor [bacterium]